MQTYAVKIGEIMLRSNKPITEAQRKHVMRELWRKGEYTVFKFGGLEAVVSVGLPPAGD
jgi:hypothetical protein